MMMADSDQSGSAPLIEDIDLETDDKMLDLDLGEGELDMAELIAAASEWDERSSGKKAAGSSQHGPPSPGSVRADQEDSGLSMLLSDVALFDAPERSQGSEGARPAPVKPSLISSVAPLRSTGSASRAEVLRPLGPLPSVLSERLKVSAASGLSMLLSDVPLVEKQADKTPAPPRSVRNGALPAPSPVSTAPRPRSELSELFSSVPIIEAEAALRAAEAQAKAAAAPSTTPGATAGATVQKRTASEFSMIELADEPLSPLTPVPHDLDLVEPPALRRSSPSIPAIPPALVQAEAPRPPAPRPPAQPTAPDEPEEELDVLMIEEGPSAPSIAAPAVAAPAVAAAPASGSAGSPLREEDLFADLDADPGPAQRPLVARARTGETPDFTVEFDEGPQDLLFDPAHDGDALLKEPTTDSGGQGASPLSFPPPPHRSDAPFPLDPPGPAKGPPDPISSLLDEAGAALRQSDPDRAFDRLEQAMEAGAGNPESIRPHTGRLAELYETFLNPLGRIPRAGRFPNNLDSQSAFMLSLLDGSMTIEEALTISGMDRLRGARTMALLLRRGLIRLS
jgi:hypothetical protein